jgi:hypothetical protein
VQQNGAIAAAPERQFETGATPDIRDRPVILRYRSNSSSRWIH